jgi:hypothetical protein
MPNLINSQKLAKVQTFKVSFQGHSLIQVCYDWTVVSEEKIVM